ALVVDFLELSTKSIETPRAPGRLLLKKRTRRKSSVLSRQKPQKPKKTKGPRRRWKWLAGTLALGLVVGGALWIADFVSELTLDDLFAADNRPKDWRVSLNVVGD